MARTPFQPTALQRPAIRTVVEHDRKVRELEQKIDELRAERIAAIVRAVDERVAQGMPRTSALKELAEALSEDGVTRDTRSIEWWIKESKTKRRGPSRHGPARVPAARRGDVDQDVDALEQAVARDREIRETEGQLAGVRVDRNAAASEAVGVLGVAKAALARELSTAKRRRYVMDINDWLAEAGGEPAPAPTARARIRQLLAIGNEHTAEQVAQQLGISFKTALQTLNALVDDGEANRERRPGPNGGWVLVFSGHPS